MSGIAVSTTMVVVASVVWASNKGFDLSDEGSYVLGYQPYQVSGVTLSSYHLIVRALLGFLTIDILTARLLRLMLTLAGLWLISRSLSAYAAEHHVRSYRPRVAFGVLATGMFYSYSFGPQSLSYNHLTQFLAVVYCCCAIGITSRRSKQSMRFALATALGPVLVLMIQIKATTGLGFLACTGPLLWVAFGNSDRARTLAFGAHGVALLLSMVAYATFIQSPKEALEAFRTAKRFSQALPDYSWRSLGSDLAGFLGTALTLLSLFVVLLMVRTFLGRRTGSRVISDGLPVIAGLAVLGAWDARTSLLHWAHGLYLPALCSIAAAITSCHERGWLSLRELPSAWVIQAPRVVVLILLYLSPILIGFGSNNGTQVVAVVGAVFAFGLWLLATDAPAESLGQRVLVLLVMGYAVWGIETNLVFRPYRQAPLGQQTRALDFLPRNQSIRVDAETYEFVRRSYELVGRGAGPRRSILALYRLPGLVYLLDGVSPGGLVWSEGTNALIAENMRRWGGRGPDVIISEQPEVNADLSSRFLANGLELRGRYGLLGKLSYRNRHYFFFSRL